MHHFIYKNTKQSDNDKIVAKVPDEPEYFGFESNRRLCYHYENYFLELGKFINHTNIMSVLQYKTTCNFMV